MPEILCNSEECAFFETLGQERQLIRHGGRPQEWDKYKGKCIRPEIGIKVRVIETYSVKYVIPECRTFSNKYPAGHLDFSRFPKGGHIDAETSKELSRDEKIRKESSRGKLFY